jgi:hypothetical protein
VERGTTAGVGKEPQGLIPQPFHPDLIKLINVLTARAVMGEPLFYFLFAVAHKLIRVIFAILPHRTYFKVKKAIKE